MFWSEIWGFLLPVLPPLPSSASEAEYLSSRPKRGLFIAAGKRVF